MDLVFTLCKLQLLFWPSSLRGVLGVAGEMKVQLLSSLPSSILILHCAPGNYFFAF